MAVIFYDKDAKPALIKAAKVAVVGLKLDYMLPLFQVVLPVSYMAPAPTYYKIKMVKLLSRIRFLLGLITLVLDQSMHI